MADGSVHIEPETPGTEPSAQKPKRARVRMQRDPEPKQEMPKQTREQSSIGFPYMDQDAAISVARAILDKGGVAVTRDQLAGIMNMSPSSGGFILKTATARLFGLIVSVQGKYELTNLGFAILDTDDKRQRAARSESFLLVPLFKRVYEEFRGKQLPPRPHGLEQAFVKFGVAQKQRSNARWAFEKSARQAGFFASGDDRLIEPIVGSAPPRADRIRAEVADFEDDTIPTERVAPFPKAPAVAAKSYHPFIQGLLDALPEPGTVWAIEGQAAWLTAAAQNFKLMYQGDGQITVEAAKTGNSDGLRRDIERWKKDLAMFEDDGLGQSGPANLIRGWIAEAEDIIKGLERL